MVRGHQGRIKSRKTKTTRNQNAAVIQGFWKTRAKGSNSVVIVRNDDSVTGGLLSGESINVEPYVSIHSLRF